MSSVDPAPLPPQHPLRVNRRCADGRSSPARCRRRACRATAGNAGEAARTPVAPAARDRALRASGDSADRYRLGGRATVLSRPRLLQGPIRRRPSRRATGRGDAGRNSERDARRERHRARTAPRTSLMRRGWTRTPMISRVGGALPRHGPNLEPQRLEIDGRTSRARGNSAGLAPLTLPIAAATQRDRQGGPALRDAPARDEPRVDGGARLCLEAVARTSGPPSSPDHSLGGHGARAADDRWREKVPGWRGSRCRGKGHAAHGPSWVSAIAGSRLRSGPMRMRRARSMHRARPRQTRTRAGQARRCGGTSVSSPPAAGATRIAGGDRWSQGCRAHRLAASPSVARAVHHAQKDFCSRLLDGAHSLVSAGCLPSPTRRGRRRRGGRCLRVAPRAVAAPNCWSPA